jgi:hypothetical protein
LVDFHKIWYGDNAIEGDPDAIICNPMASKWLRRKVEGMMFSLAQPMVWDCFIVGLVLLGVFDCWFIIIGISLANSTMATIAYCGIVLLLGYYSWDFLLLGYL